MSDRIFEFIPKLEFLENYQRWEDIRIMLYQLWSKDKLNWKIALRLISECWLVLSQWDWGIDHHGLCYDVFKNNLLEVCWKSNQFFQQNDMYLTIVGYMISLFPELFSEDTACSDKDYCALEKTGNEMMEKGYNLNKQNLLASVLFWGSKRNELHFYSECRKLIQPHLASLFPGETEIEKYFKDILSN
jgi:hypothetical protein